jgi:predicted Zn-dependent peptidase
VPQDELEKAKSFAKGRFVLQLETSQGLIMFGLRREVLESRTPDPEEILGELEKVTAEDVQRVAQDLIGSRGLNLAVIGPFDDPARFEQLLA